ncbi:50S ribosomal protein L33 [Candidatus Roizmanbacteria bacterium]|nr:50S ribosomal protein L33 [Candidatus Roizmanbacteria bacterium]
MAKEGNRIVIGLECSVCHNRNYVTSKNRLEQKGKMKFNKYCSTCRKKTEHKESKKLK